MDGLRERMRGLGFSYDEVAAEVSRRYPVRPSAEWEYCPWSPQDADPGLTADLATALLTGQAGPQPRLGSGTGSRTSRSRASSAWS